MFARELKIQDQLGTLIIARGVDLLNEPNNYLHQTGIKSKTYLKMQKMRNKKLIEITSKFIIAKYMR